MQPTSQYLDRTDAFFFSIFFHPFLATKEPRLVVYYLQVREEPLLPPVEDFQVPPSMCVVLGCWVFVDLCRCHGVCSTQGDIPRYRRERLNKWLFLEQIFPYNSGSCGDQVVMKPDF